MGLPAALRRQLEPLRTVELRLSWWLRLPVRRCLLRRAAPTRSSSTKRRQHWYYQLGGLRPTRRRLHELRVRLRLLQLPAASARPTAENRSRRSAANARMEPAKGRPLLQPPNQNHQHRPDSGPNPVRPEVSRPDNSSRNYTRRKRRKFLLCGHHQQRGERLRSSDPAATPEAAAAGSGGSANKPPVTAVNSCPGPDEGNAAAEGDPGGTIYREGTPSPSNLKPRPSDNGKLSFRSSLSNPYPLAEGQRPVFRPNEPYFGIDTSQLPDGSITYDNIPPGHVSVEGVPPDALKKAVTERGSIREGGIPDGC